MIMGKKLLILFITVAFLFQLTALAEESPILCVSSAQTAAGQTVEIKISLENNPGIVSMRLALDYDSDALQLVSVEDKGILGTSVHGDDLNSTSYMLCWANDTSTSNYFNNGTLVVLRFLVKKGTLSGNYPIRVSYDNYDYDIFDVNFNTVDFNISNGIISVGKSNECDILNSTATILGDNIQVKAKLSGEIKGVIIFASYSNYLEDLKICKAAETVEALLEYKNADLVKIMWWDLSTLSPYAQKKEIKIK